MPKKITIIGLGLIGGSLAKAIKKSNSELIISAFDIPEVLQKAKEEKVIDVKFSSIEESVNSDIIFLCLPVDVALEIFEKLAPILNENSILTDVCGVKNIFQEKWNKIKSKGLYVGGHPMTGKEKGGYDNSDPLLFENSVYILTDSAKDLPERNNLISIIESIGARITFVPPEIHDEIVAYVSHLPQMVAVSLVNTASKKNNDKNFIDFAAGGFYDMTRIASSDFNVWEPILKQNKDKILFAIESLKNELEVISNYLNENDIKSIADKFETARRTRDEIPKNRKGFLNPLYDIYIFVPDEPGVISKISTALFKENINIKDIELLKIREGAGGTFRLSLESEGDAIKSKIIMDKIGFKTN
ncbi:MAG: prephenate dehydrogenase/arogenate dehydrogenase family protein [Ignavibacteriales bacterium]|nr:prephenate dehydrogenase/arogenate dehydrogenase family protein [Ignavibacteriales bacterium]